MQLRRVDVGAPRPSYETSFSSPEKRSTTTTSPPRSHPLATSPTSPPSPQPTIPPPFSFTFTPPPTPQCPVCNIKLPCMSDLQITNHIDECLTKSFLDENPSTTTTQSIIEPILPFVSPHKVSSVVEPTIICPYYMCGRSMTVLEFAYHVKATHKSHAQNVYCPICAMLGETQNVDSKKLNLWAHLHSDHADVMGMLVIGTNPQNTPLSQFKSPHQDSQYNTSPHQTPHRKVQFIDPAPQPPPRINIQQLLNPDSQNQNRVASKTGQSFYSETTGPITQCDDLWDESEEDYDEVSNSDSGDDDEDDFWVPGVRSHVASRSTSHTTTHTHPSPPVVLPTSITRYNVNNINNNNNNNNNNTHPLVHTIPQAPPPPLPRAHTTTNPTAIATVAAAVALSTIPTTTTTTTAITTTTTSATPFAFPTVVSANYMAYTLQGTLPIKECSICLDDFAEGEIVARVECMCVFHQCCIEKWYSKKKCCPFHMPDDETD